MSPEHAARARRSYAERRPVRAALRRGDITITAVMREQPDGLADRTLFEILLMAHQFGRARLRALNDRALDDEINLAMTLGRADERTREWVARNALPNTRRRPASLWAQLMDDNPSA
jgi:hypothetical protein